MKHRTIRKKSTKAQDYRKALHATQQTLKELYQWSRADALTKRHLEDVFEALVANIGRSMRR